MDLIDIYVSEVGRRLPPKSRLDIEAEIHSVLEDNLEARRQAAGRPVDDEMTYEVLKEYGNPEKVAASYLPERYLIGPSLYPSFMVLVKLILWVTGVLALVGLVISLVQSANSLQTAYQVFSKAVTEFYTSVLTSLVCVVLIFAISEWAVYRYGGSEKIKGLPKTKEWDPHALGKILPINRVKLGDVIAEVVFTFIAILLFNFYPQAFALSFLPNGTWIVGLGSSPSTPFLSAAFFQYIPYLTILWSLTIILDIVQLRQGYWNTLTRLGSIGLKVLNVVLAGVMLAGPSLIALNAASIPANALNPATVQAIVTLLPQIVRLALWITVIVGTFEVIGRVYGLVKASYYRVF